MIKDENMLLVLRSSGFGEGEPDLGETLMRSFLNMLKESGKAPAKMVFMNSAIFLTTEGSPVLGILAGFAEAGCEILSCGTCLNYYDREEKLAIGKVTNMRATVNDMLAFPRVLTL